MNELQITCAAPQGWQCPLCKRIYSPTTPMCWYCGEEGAKKTYTTTTSNPLNEYQERKELLMEEMYKGGFIKDE